MSYFELFVIPLLIVNVYYLVSIYSLLYGIFYKKNSLNTNDVANCFLNTRRKNWRQMINDER